MPETRNTRPTVLIILDGWGVAPPSRSNALSQARLPYFNKLVATYPTLTLQASGEASGLPWGEVGNSEVGHMNIGAGRIVYQEFTRISQAISSGSFFDNQTLLDAIAHVKKNKSAMHLLGMVSSGGVHSYNEHLYALLELMKRSGVEKVYIHAILDGRDTSYTSGVQFIQKLQEKIASIGVGEIATLGGRFYGMDRDNHWDREEKAYRAIAEGISDSVSDDPIAAINASYAKEVYDEEFAPTVITKNGKAVGKVEDGDAVIFYNFRADRARQLSQAFVAPDFNKFTRKEYKNLSFTTLTQYDRRLPVAIAYQPQTISNCLAEVVSKQGLKQLHIAETEKYAHVTYFLNGGREEQFPGEQRILIPSPKVDSYDKKPEMSAREITDNVLDAVSHNKFEFIAVNFANADMVAHTGNLKATIAAGETIDRCLQQIVNLVLIKNGAVVITADHGNAEVLLDLQTGTIDKEHNTSPVPCIIIAKELEGRQIGLADVAANDLSFLEPNGILSDVAPTVLDLMGIEKPAEMTGSNLLALSTP